MNHLPHGFEGASSPAYARLPSPLERRIAYKLQEIEFRPVGARGGRSSALYLQFQRDPSVRSWGADGSGRAARGGEVRAEGR